MNNIAAAACSKLPLFCLDFPQNSIGRRMRDAEDITFGRFRLRRRQHQLLQDGVPVELGSRAIDILLTLIDAEGAPVSKDELMKRVWPGIVVEENNLTVQISALRKVLGDHREIIRTVSRHGYSFVADALTRGVAPPAANPDDSAAGSRKADNIRVPLDALIGREHDLHELLALSGSSRLLTLTGPGGIGKTRLALELARMRQAAFPDWTYLAELAALSDASLVAASVATALGLDAGAATRSVQAAAVALAGKRLLLVLENCEHVVVEAARVAEALLHATAGLQIVATSREPLGGEGEHVYRVNPLRIPGERIVDASEILRHGAVQLFIARARAAGVDLPASEAQLNNIVAICRRLDGIPLAIELAAARVGMLGVDDLRAWMIVSPF
jgi:DNA-binding winged helix-turn-helix (wHTH) protein